VHRPRLGVTVLSISLLLATYKSKTGPLKHRDTWMSKANIPDRIEWIVAMDNSDLSAIGETEGMIRAINRPRDSFSTAVQNWNSAARLSNGNLLFVISDDLFPFPGWDSKIQEIVGTRDPEADDFAIKVQDSPNPCDTALRHPVVSRKFYDRLGLFDGSFRGVLCDSDFTLKALLYSQILDGREAVFCHAHPHFDPSLASTDSHLKINRQVEYSFGRRAFNRKYSPFHQGLNLNRLNLPTAGKSARLLLGVRRFGIWLKGRLLTVRGERELVADPQSFA